MIRLEFGWTRKRSKIMSYTVQNLNPEEITAAKSATYFLQMGWGLPVPDGELIL